MPELLDESTEAYKAGYRTISDIGSARIQKVIEIIESQRLVDLKNNGAAGVDPLIGFDFFRLSPSNFKEWRADVDNGADLLAQLEYHVDSTRPDSEAQCMIYELLLKMALPITTPVKCHELKVDKKVMRIYLATPETAKPIAIFFDNLSTLITDFILQESPAKVVCLNKSFQDSKALTNFSLQLEDANIALEIL